jgi:hypothetical protein
MIFSPQDPGIIPTHRRLARGRKGIDAIQFLLKGDAPMESPSPENSDLVKNSVLYKEFLAEREEILKHKWLESEKVGHDIGFEKALLDWIVKYRSAWRDKRHKQPQPAAG